MRGDDRIDPSVGLADVALIGDAVGPDTPLATVHAGDDDAAAAAAATVLAAYKISSSEPEIPPLIYRSVN